MGYEGFLLSEQFGELGLANFGFSIEHWFDIFLRNLEPGISILAEKSKETGGKLSSSNGATTTTCSFEESLE